MLIDFHTHCFPAALAPKALGALTGTMRKVPATDGTERGLLLRMEQDGVDLSVVCNIATNPKQEHNVNGFAIGLNDYSPRLIALGSVHPDSENAEAELDRLTDHDIRGIKIHPEYAAYYIDDGKWDRIFSLCEERGIFVVTHAGFDRISPDRIAVTPERLGRVLDRHPGLTLVAAHLGGAYLWDEVYTCLCGRGNVYFDTAVIAGLKIDPVLAKKIILAHGTDRILFGTDCPWSTAAAEKAFLSSLSLGTEAEERIFHRNAKELLFRS